MLKWHGQRARGLGYLAAAGAVLLVSLFIGLVLGQLSVANISMLYLIAVLTTAVVCGRGPAIFASVAAFLTFDWFFVQPLHQFTVADPEEWISLLLFLLTAIVTGQLAADQRQRAHEAEQREREARVLYDVVRLVGDRDLEDALASVAERLRSELGLAAGVVEITQHKGRTMRVAVGEERELKELQTGAGSPGDVLNAGRVGSGGRRVGRWIRLVPAGRPASLDGRIARDRLHLVPVRAEARRVGALVLVSAPGAPPFDEAADRLLSAAAAQLGLAVERERLRQQATEAEILRRTDELRRALLNAVSHDFRTPLASIVASAGSLLQEDVEWTDEERRDFTQAIVDESQRLNRIVGNLLDLSRIEAGTLRPEKGWYDLGVLVDEVVGRLRPVTARHYVQVDLAEGLPAVPLDYVEIDQVLTNLIENAAKYAPTSTEITVSVRARRAELLVTVDDRGRGIPASEVPHLFDPFYRIADGTPRPAGLGLGLAVAKGLIEAHGGRIWVEHRPGGGARFAFTLPTPDQAPAPPILEP